MDKNNRLPKGRVALLLCLMASSLAHAGIVASDHADNDPYPVTGFLPGDNGGFGFDEWVELETGNPGAMYTTASIDSGSYSWGLGGTYALGRGLSNNLAVGSWNFLAVHDSDNTDFSGFNLKSSASIGSFASDELFRVGMDPSQFGYDGTGVYVSTNAGTSYLFLDCGWVDGEGDTIEYTIGWNTVAGTYSLSVSNQTEGVSINFLGNMPTASSIAMLGTGVFGASLDEGMVFDNYGVVPEPHVLGVLVFGALAMGFLRKLFLV